MQVEDITLRRPTLEDVFLRLTGHRADESDQTDSPDDTDGTGQQQMEEATR